MPRRKTLYPVEPDAAGACCACAGDRQDEQQRPGTMKSNTHVRQSYQLGGSPRTARRRRNRRDFCSSSDCGGREGPGGVPPGSADQRHPGADAGDRLLRGVADAAGADDHRPPRARVGRHDPARRAGRAWSTRFCSGSISFCSARTCSSRRSRMRSAPSGFTVRRRRGRSRQAIDDAPAFDAWSEYQHARFEFAGAPVVMARDRSAWVSRVLRLSRSRSCGCFDAALRGTAARARSSQEAIDAARGSRRATRCSAST